MKPAYCSSSPMGCVCSTSHSRRQDVKRFLGRRGYQIPRKDKSPVLIKQGVMGGIEGGMGDITSCIYNVPIFRALPPDSVRNLQRAMVHRPLQAGETCARSGDLVR